MAEGGGRGGQAMLLVEQGVLWVLPMLWLVLLLSEAGAVVETGCSLEMGPALRRRSREGVGRRGGRGGKKNNVGPKNKTRRRQGRQEIGRASCRKECRSRWSPYH